MEWPKPALLLTVSERLTQNILNMIQDGQILSLFPSASANPMALKAIEQADMVVIAPGDLYTSAGPLLIIDGIAEALQKQKRFAYTLATWLLSRDKRQIFRLAIMLTKLSVLLVSVLLIMYSITSRFQVKIS